MGPWKDTWSSMVWKCKGDPPLTFSGPVQSFLEVWGQCGRVKVVYFTPQQYRGVRAEFLVCTPSRIVYLGHLYTGESGQLHPLIFLGTVQYLSLIHI